MNSVQLLYCIAFHAAVFATNNTSLKLNVNEHADKFLAKLSHYMLKRGVEPTHLQDVTLDVQYQPLFITYTAALHLKDGVVYNIAAMKRDGDVEMALNEPAVVRCPIKYDFIKFKYHYDVALMGFGPSGGISATVYEPKIIVTAAVALKSYQLKLVSFEIVDTGRIDVNFNGHYLWDWFVELVSKVVIRYLHDRLLRFFSSTVEAQISAYIQDMNNYTLSYPNVTSNLVGKLFVGHDV